MKEYTFKGTPGPWKVINGWNDKGEGKYFPSVVFTDKSKFSDNGARCVVNASHDQEIPSLMGNAYLIAAAPDLLQACIEVFEKVEHYPEILGPCTNTMLQAAIHKALNL